MLSGSRMSYGVRLTVGGPCVAGLGLQPASDVHWGRKGRVSPRSGTHTEQGMTNAMSEMPRFLHLQNTFLQWEKFKYCESKLNDVWEETL